MLHNTGTIFERLLNIPRFNSVFLTVCLENILFGNCIVLGFHLSQCVGPILLYKDEKSPAYFFYGNTWTSNIMALTDDFTDIHAFSYEY